MTVLNPDRARQVRAALPLEAIERVSLPELLSFAKHVPVFPCDVDSKSPLVEHGFKDATQEAKLITEYWTRWPDALVAVPTGTVTGRLMLDVDTSLLNARSKLWLESNAELLMGTRVHHSRRIGHKQYWFKQPEGVKTRICAAVVVNGEHLVGIDIRGDGGYSIWWPLHGLHAEGLAKRLPDALLPLFVGGERATVKHGNGNGEAGLIIERGHRNDFLSREAFRLRKQGSSVEQVEKVIAAMNEARCSPPLDAREVHQIAQGKATVPPEPIVSQGEPTPLVRPIPTPDPFPMDALGPVLHSAARAIVEIVQVPEALAANSVLAAAALAAQPHASVQTLGGARPISLYILTVAGSGDRKSAADDVALSPVHDHMKRMMLTYQAALAEYERELAASKLAKSMARKEAATPDAFAAALEDITTEPKPRKPWLICSEPTSEGLMRSLAEGQHAQGIFSDEGGQFLGGHALSEESELRTIAMLSRAWQGSPLDRVRATNDEHVILYGRRLSMHLMCQPDVAIRLLGRPLYRAQGFLARWLIAAPDSLAGSRKHNPDYPEAKDDPRIRRYWHALAELLAQAPIEDREAGGLAPPCLALSPEARVLLVDAYNEIEAQQGAGKELEPIREWASKSAEHACRIAAVLTMVESPSALTVSGQAMRYALKLMQHYLNEYVRLIGATGISEEIARAQLLLDWIRRKVLPTITARKVMQFGPGSIRSADAAKGAIHTLVSHGWLSTDHGKSFGVHPTALEVQP